MSEPAVILVLGGLKCDAPGCDYVDPTAPVDETQLNRPCPKCGANLLTEADLANVRLLQYITHAVNVECGPAQDGAERESIRFEMNGSGSLEMIDEETA